MKIILTPLFIEAYQLFDSCNSIFSIMIEQRICLMKYRKKSRGDEANEKKYSEKKKNPNFIFPQFFRCPTHISIGTLLLIQADCY